MPLVRASGGGSPDSLPEERRLFYVSLTRAKHRLRLTHTLHTSHFGPQSRRDGLLVPPPPPPLLLLLSLVKCCSRLAGLVVLRCWC